MPSTAPAEHVVLADDREVHAAGEHLEVAAQHDRVAEVGQRLDEQQQEAGRDARQQERQRHRAERAPARGAQVRGRLVERRVERAHQARQADVGDREEAQRHHQRQALAARRCRSRMPSRSRVMMPLRPNRTIAASASANGGLTIGSSAMTCMKRLSGRGSGTRTCTYANRKPIDGAHGRHEQRPGSPC